jgi:FAD/FMN-containing dehydrogenase
MKKLRNWAGNVVWRPKAVHRPRDEREISELVRLVAERGERLKPVGSGLSWSDINEVEGQQRPSTDWPESFAVQRRNIG